MKNREEQVRRLLDTYKSRSAGARESGPQSPDVRQADARMESIRRASTRGEYDEFIDRSLDHTLGSRWRDGRAGRGAR